MNKRGGYNRHRQQLESWSAATIRALSRRHDLYFRARKLYCHTHPLPFSAAHLQADPETTDIQGLRGISDGLALRLLHSDIVLHARLMPEEIHEQLIFELLEQLRVESRVPATLPGVRRNLRQHFEGWLLAFHTAGLTETGFGLLLFTLAQVCWAHINHYPPLAETEDLMEATRAGIMPLLGTALSELVRHREDQAAYAQPALHIARVARQLLEAEQLATPAKHKPKTLQVNRKLLQLLNISEGEEKEGFLTAHSGESRLFHEQGGQYQVYTRAYDQTVHTTTLLRADRLKILRQQLDEQIQQSGLNVQRLSRLLQGVFATPHRHGWHSGLTDGYIDGSRLARLITSPDDQAIFKQEAHPPRCHAIITFLLDCSGSMKRHGAMLAILLDTFARAMDKTGIPCEILGFSTRRWNGGRALKDWRRQGKPPAPGRLNETVHFIFRDADAPRHRTRDSLAVLLKSDIYKEGVDGEAVEWAAKRLLAHDTDRRILMVVSDGCPMDGATAQANDEFYLDNHLQQVVQRYDQPGRLEIYGLGVGLDLGLYYHHHLSLDPEKGLDNQLLSDIVALWN